MKTTNPETDRIFSSASEEFIWDTEEHTENHRLVIEPISRILLRYGAKSVLDIGCGNGALTAAISGKGFNIKGIDHSTSGIEAAKKRQSSVEFEQHDITQKLSADYNEQYDAVISVEVIEHLLLPRKLMENAMSALKPGGVFALTTPFHGYWKNLALALTNQYDYHWHPLRDYGHIKFFSKATITMLFEETGFKDIEFRAVGRIPPLAKSMIISGIK